MKELTDEKFRELFNPASKGTGFITDASRRTIIDKLKSQNFLAFNPLTFNIFYVVAISILLIFVISGLMSKNAGTNADSSAHIDFHTLKREVPVAKIATPVPASAPVAVADTAQTAKVIPPVEENKTVEPVAQPVNKNIAPVTTAVVKEDLFNGVTFAKEVLKTVVFNPAKGIPVLYILPELNTESSNVLLPAMPDSLPPQKKVVVRPRPEPIVHVTPAHAVKDSTKPLHLIKKDSSSTLGTPAANAHSADSPSPVQQKPAAQVAPAEVSTPPVVAPVDSPVVQETSRRKKSDKSDKANKDK